MEAVLITGIGVVTAGMFGVVTWLKIIGVLVEPKPIIFLSLIMPLKRPQLSMLKAGQNTMFIVFFYKILLIEHLIPQAAATFH